MNDEEAFEYWLESMRFRGDRPEGYERRAWQAACEWKQHEVDAYREAARTEAEFVNELQADKAKLEIQLWQALGAMGYPVPGHIPEGDYKCGLCESKEVQMIRKDAHQEALLEVIRILSNNRSA